MKTEAEQNPRFIAAKMGQRFEELSQRPRSQAEAIVEHYRRMCSAIMDLGDMVALRKSGSLNSPALNDAIEHMTETIQDAHREDFGIALEWPAK